MNGLARRYLDAIKDIEFAERTGHVAEYFGLVIESEGPEVFLGELCEIEAPYSNGGGVLAEVVGLKNGRVLLMPFAEPRGLSVGSRVRATGRPLQVPVGVQLLGRIVDAFCRPLDGKPLGGLGERYMLQGQPINPLERPRINQILETGVRAIDSLLTIGRGQRMGIFAGSGVGKSALLGMIARNMNADVNVIALIGERGREVLDFIEQSLGPEGLRRSVVIVATSDQPALLRSHAALAATSIAEFFRDQGMSVVLMMDSVTRFAMAHREIGLAIGEPPTARGYTPSVFAVLPKLLERAGCIRGGGSITGLYTVLIEGDDIHDPIADGVRSILDGHIVLTRELANHQHYPAIDVLQSKSRLLDQLVGEEELAVVKQAVGAMSLYEKSKDLIEVGAYRKGVNPELDRAVDLMPRINRHLIQDRNESVSRRDGIVSLSKALGSEKAKHENHTA